MLKISQQQALNRWDTLPDNLREALFSEYNSETLWKICENQHLSEDKIGVIATLAGDVILGFLHPDDLASEIRKDLNLIPELANLIASEIDRKIFASIRSEIEKVYSPVIEADQRGLEILEADLRGDEIASPSARNDGKDEVEPISIPIEIKKPELPIRIIGFEEEENHQITNQDEYTNKDKEVKESALAEGPMIIHEETEFKPLSESKKSLKSLGGLFGFLSASRRKKEKLEEIKPVRAEIEGIGSPKKIEDIKPVETKIKVVDYTEVPEKSPNNESARIYESKDENHRITNQDEYTNKNNEGENVANEIEPPIKILEEENHRITNQDEYTNKIEEIEKIELEEKIEKPKDEIMTTTMTEEKKEELPFDGPIIISEKPKEIEKKKFFSKLSGLFRKSSNNESKQIYESKSKDEKYADTKKE
ncbi:MAG: hypothetical protein Q8N28_00410 [bacterium]|nr:hypothetical protein [bacterium]